MINTLLLVHSVSSTGHLYILCSKMIVAARAAHDGADQVRHWVGGHIGERDVMHGGTDLGYSSVDLRDLPIRR